MPEEKKKVDAIVKAEPLSVSEITEDIVHDYINHAATREEVFFFLQACAAWDLNPFKREIYLIKYNQTEKAQFVMGYEVFLKRANAIPLLDGWKVDVVYDAKNEHPIRANIVIYRKDWTRPFEHSVRFQEYVQHKQDGTTTKMWAKMEETMIRKVVTGQGFRLCFPIDLGGMPYLAEEIPAGGEGALPEYKMEKTEAPKVTVTPYKPSAKAQDVPGKAEEVKPAPEPQPEPQKPKEEAQALPAEATKAESPAPPTMDKPPRTRKPKAEAKEEPKADPEFPPKEEAKAETPSKPELISDSSPHAMITEFLAKLSKDFGRDQADMEKKLIAKINTKYQIEFKGKFPGDLTEDQAWFAVGILDNTWQKESKNGSRTNGR